MANFLLVLGQSDYSALNVLTTGLARGLQAMGHNPVFLDIRCPPDVGQMNSLRQYSYDLVISLNARGINLKCQGQRMAQLFRAPFLSWLTDSINYHHNRMRAENMAGFDFIAMADRQGARYARRYLSRLSAVKAVMFLPMFGLEDDDSGTSLQLGYHDRDIDIVFFSPCPELVERRWDSYDITAYRRLADEIVSLCLTGRGMSLFSAIEKVLADSELVSADRVLDCGEWYAAMAELETYVRWELRRRVIDSLHRGGVRLTVFGPGWQGSRYAGQFDLHEAVDMAEVPAILRRSKMALNISPHMRWGLQERVPTAMLNGAVAVSDYGEYLAENFVPGQDLLVYAWNEIEGLPDMIRECLGSPVRWEAIRGAGYVRARDSHNAAARAGQLIEISQLAKYFATLR